MPYRSISRSGKVAQTILSAEVTPGTADVLVGSMHYYWRKPGNFSLEHWAVLPILHITKSRAITAIVHGPTRT